MSKTRLLSAFAVAPLAVPLVYCLFSLIVSDSHPVKNASILVGLLFVAVYGLPIAYLAELLLGFPAWMVFRHYGVTSVTAFGVCGALIGWLVALSGSLLARIPTTNVLNPLSSDRLSFDLFFVVSAAVSAIFFRVILYSGRPTFTRSQGTTFRSLM